MQCVIFVALVAPNVFVWVAQLWAQLLMKKSYTTVQKFQEGLDMGRKTVNKSANSNLLPPWLFNYENPKFPAGYYNVAVTLIS